jgi:exopolysaccharide biosynthesis polyprenyl glycosylphosphotransferase
MTVIEQAVEQPTGWPLVTTTPGRQDARRRAAVAVTDAAAAIFIAIALAAWMDSLPLPTAMLVPAFWTVAAWALGAYRYRRLRDGLTDPGSIVRTTLLLIAAAGLLTAATPIGGGRALVLIAVPLTGAGILLARAALLPLTRDGDWLAPAPLVVLGPRGHVQAFMHSANVPGAAPCRIAATCIVPEPEPGPHAVAELTPAVLTDLHATLQRTGADTVVVAGQLDPHILRLLAWDLEDLGVGVAVMPLWPVAPHRISARTLGFSTGIEVRPPRYDSTAMELRELFDRSAALAALILALPLLVLIGLTVKITSPGGPILFSHHRTGKDGRRFKLLKFRTMVPNAEALKKTLGNQYADGTLFKLKADPRITPVGRFLRKFSLDELPQLVNVVRGDMLLVGPRPTSTPPERMRADYFRRTLVKPGLTGLWQVSGRSDLSWEDAVRLDVHYVENRSLELDLDILFRKTLPAVLGKRGAY